LKEYHDFLLTIDILIPNLVQLLGSKSTGDVLEAIKLLMYLKKFNIESSEVGIKKMIVLVWSKDKVIKEEIVNSYYNIYMNIEEFSPKIIAFNLINLLSE
jgi:condensin complex subunit 1